MSHAVQTLLQLVQPDQPVPPVGPPSGKEQAPAINYPAIMPVLIVLGAACLGVLLEAFLPRHQRWLPQVVLTLLAIAGACAALAFYVPDAPAQGEVTLASTIAVDRPALFLWGTLLALAACAVPMIADRSVEPGGALVAHAAIRPGTVQDREQRLGALPHRSEAARFQMQTEAFPLALFSLGGMMVFCAANDLLTMFVALEVLSLPLYLMAGLARRRRLLSQEAAVKYFLLGAFASAFFLYGLALLYGFAGSVRLADIAAAAPGNDRSDKVAAFGGILRVLAAGFQPYHWQWRGVLWGVAIVSMIIGAVLGLTQTDIKRMIAYSSIAHAGFMLVGAIVLTPNGLSSTLFYLITYGFSTIATFGVISLVRDADGEATHLSQWAGLAKRSPVVAGIFTFLLLALAGIPLTSGFIGKFVVFSAAMANGLQPLVVIALVMSAVAAFFYLRVIVLMYFSEPAADGPTVTLPGPFTTAAITLGVLVTLVLGIVPSFALDWASTGNFALR